MHLQLGVVADHANIAQGGKLNILGVFDTIWAADFPAVHPFMVLALRFRQEYEDEPGEHQLAVTLEDEDGKQYMKATATATLKKLKPGEVRHIDQILNFAGMGFGRPGHYAFHVSWDGRELDRVELYLVKGQPGQ